MVVAALYLGGTRGKLLLGTLVGAFICFQILGTVGLINPRFLGTETAEDSANSHEALLTIGLSIAMDNFFTGIGHDDFEEVSVSYSDRVDKGADAVGKYQPHNDFINVWVSWGIFALIAYSGAMIGALRNYWIACRTGDGFVRAAAIGAAAGLTRWAAESTFHNALDNGTLLWMYLGVSIALVQLAQRYPSVRPVAIPWEYLVDRRRRRMAAS
jgi:hypothetical protein